MAKDYSGRLTVIGIAGRDTTAEMKKFVERHNIGFITVADPDAEIWAALGIPGQPASIFINGKDGATSRPVFGAIKESALRNALDDLTSD